jgi:hypothetical protein
LWVVCIVIRDISGWRYLVWRQRREDGMQEVNWLIN